MRTLYVGVDVSQKTLDVATCWPAEPPHPQSLTQVSNDLAGWLLLQQALGDYLCAVNESVTLRLVLEPTGGYEQPLARWALKQGWLVSLPNPRQVRDWAKGQGRRAKTDRQDALLLAHYGASTCPPPWQPPPEAAEQLRALIERRRDLQKMQQQERNRRHALQARQTYSGPVAQSLEQSINWLQQALADLDQAIDQHLDQHPPLAAQAEELDQLPGIGSGTRLQFLTHLTIWSSLTANQGSSKALTAFTGLDPLPYESGSSVHKKARISKQGDPEMRRALYLAARGAVRGHSPLRDFYDRLRAAGKSYKTAIVAVAHKLLCWAWAVFRDHQPYREELARPKPRPPFQHQPTAP